MKTKLLLTSLLSFYFCLLSSQVPQGLNYQALAGDASGNPIRNTDLQVKISILSDTIVPVIIWEELHPAIKTNAHGIFSLVVGKGSRQAASTVTDFSDISWSATPLYLKTQIYYQSSWKSMGSAKLWTVPYSMVAGDLSGALKKLSVTGNTSSMDEALFEVKNKNGQTVFAVYNEGVRIYVDDGSKGAKGGFSIGGFDMTKGSGSQQYLYVGGDSIRAYIYDNPLIKSAKGGFAIGGYDMTKGPRPKDLLTVSDDSIRMYIDNNGKGAKGGFAIGGFDMTKGTTGHFLDVSTDATGIINPSENRILWYPIKNSFLAGKVLIENPDSVGENSMAIGYESKAKGQFSQAMGFKAIARGDYATAIGKSAVANKINSFAFGDNARALNQDSYAFGAFSEASGIGSFAFGYVGRDSIGPTGKQTLASGDFSFAFGLGSQATQKGAFALGADNTASNFFSMAFGLSTTSSGFTSTTFGSKTEANSFASMAIGFETLASGNHSFAGGDGSIASSYSSFSFGHKNLATQANSVAMGQFTKSTGENSFSIGQFSEANGKNSTALGTHNIANGNGALAGGGESKATAGCAFAFGYNTLASEFQSVAMGQNTIASGNAAVALGDLTIAEGVASLAIGSNTYANGTYSIAGGFNSKALSGNSFSFGFKTVTRANTSFAIGWETIAKSYSAFVLGRYNDTTNMSNPDWIEPTDPAFVIGNGDANNNRRNALTVLQNSNVGINMVNPQYKLDIVGGSARVESGNSWLTSSDLRYKKNITSLENSLDEVMAMRGVRFDLVNDNSDTEASGKYIGFIAQELEQIVPEVVVTGPDGYKSVAYDKLTAVLTEAIKEQQKEIEKLKSLVNILIAKQKAQEEVLTVK